MAEGVFRITEQFETELSKYTGTPYVVTVDNASNALFLCLIYENVKGKEVAIPERTYPSVPAEIIRAGGIVKFSPVEGETLKGEYPLVGTRIWDSSLRFTTQMFRKGQLQCISFTGPYKHFKLSKGGAILTDDYHAMLWFKRARFSGRRECSYHIDHFDMIGVNCYMMPEIATRGLLLIKQFYDFEDKPIHNEDIEMKYPNLSKFSVYTTPNANVWGTPNFVIGNSNE